MKKNRTKSLNKNKENGGKTEQKWCPEQGEIIVRAMAVL
jgi:hypothetical protein